MTAEDLQKSQLSSPVVILLDVESIFAGCASGLLLGPGWCNLLQFSSQPAKQILKPNLSDYSPQLPVSEGTFFQAHRQQKHNRKSSEDM
jgi:hypothetical protein